MIRAILRSILFGIILTVVGISLLTDNPNSTIAYEADKITLVLLASFCMLIANINQEAEIHKLKEANRLGIKHETLEDIMNAQEEEEDSK